MGVNMNIIQFKEANCKNCYKCIRNCDLKAIKFSDEQATVLDEKCIICGKCTLVCPQNAKQIESDIPQVKAFLKGNSKVIVSLAPSYIAAFPGVSFAAVSQAIKKLGFTKVEETAIGATQVSKEYTKLLKEKKMKNIITTCCPTTIMLIEKYYPELVDSLAPVVSPATAHAKMLKDIYGNRVKVVFIGPCISKKYEAKSGNSINATLMFDELKEWLKEENITIDENDTEPSEMHNTVSRLYPVPGGIINTIPADKRKNYKSISVDGLDRCISILDSIKENDIKGYFIEMSACAGSCVEGPGLATSKTPFLLSKDMLLSNVRKKTVTSQPITENVNVDFSAAYLSSPVKDIIPDEKVIKNILIKLGKTTEESMLNCGTCGYSTCRDKAIAVFQGKADLKMCLPHLREKAESMSNIIIQNTPNAIFMTDKEFNILEYNQSAKSLFKLDEGNIIGMPIEVIINSDEFQKVRTTGEPVFYTLCKNVNNDIDVELSIVDAPNDDYIVIAKDVTKEQENYKEIEKIRRDTIETAQKVIDKQMRVAQEIASLLGETTGETKAALTKLKKSIVQGEKL